MADVDDIEAYLEAQVDVSLVLLTIPELCNCYCCGDSMQKRIPKKATSVDMYVAWL